MSAKDRRRNLLEELCQSDGPMTGSQLADEFGVSRQVIVQDIALLRAEGKDILATSQGYITNKKEDNIVKKTIACKHSGVETREELEIIIKYGGRIRDVIVEHPLYGEIKGNLMIQKKSDLELFMKKYKEEEVKPLSTLTDGVHLHTIEALNFEVINLIEIELKKRGYLLEGR
ncbi:transcription repressor NadR [Halonatronum saccharophilum]|uniref:transcription repressor NadR n=1 Tax=Halonatronum saccharophilum TaxID=150060 RepID=UPI000487A12C|nr:transcription repressor NadR [Halonatronum saccharophilum]